MKRFKYTYQLLAALAFMACLSGCAQDDSILTPDGEETNDGKTTLLLKVNTPAISTKANTPVLSGTDAENALNRLDLFIVQNNQLVKRYSKTESNLQSPILFVLEDIDITDADIYVAANMTQAQADAITVSNMNPEMSITDITDLTGAEGFLMTGKTADKVTIEKEKVTKAGVTLDRVMCKVLLTCDTQTGNDAYVKLADDRNGYIKLSDVHYEPANTNRKFYPFAKPGNEDPNYAINDNLLNNPGSNFFPGTPVTASSKTAAKYVASKVNTNDDNRYTDGVYCLENTVSMTIFTDAYGSGIHTAKQVGTYIKISAKFTPAFIDDAENLTETAAKDKLTGATFYTYRKATEDKKHICYSSIAKGMELNAGSTEKDFTTYSGGLLEYETFVASPAEFTDRSNLKRNNYYIMHVTSITVPIREKTIEVNTTVVGWTQKGTTVVDIETNN